MNRLGSNSRTGKIVGGMMGPKVLMASPRSRNEIENIALGLIRKYQPDAEHNPQKFEIDDFFQFELEDIIPGLVCRVDSDLPQGVAGYTDSETLECVVSDRLFENTTESGNYYRYSTTAHECGHALLHINEFRKKKEILRSLTNKGAQLRFYRQESVPTFRNPEWQAWAFAQAILIPASALNKAIATGKTRFELSRLFQVNEVFVDTRFRALGITT